jgi:2-keto-4-pentenoate hydratase
MGLASDAIHYERHHRMVDSTEAASLASQYLAQVDARSAHVSLVDQTSDASLEAAYAVQDAYHALLRSRGDEIVGYKVALTSKAMQEFVGVDQPLAGAVFGSAVHDSPAEIDLSQFRHMGVEFEVAVRMASDLAPGSGAHSREDVAAAVAACHPAFELVEDRNADYSVLNPFDLVAENAWNGGVVLGAAVDDWRQVDLIEGATRLTLNGEPGGEGRTGDALGHPLDAVAFLANNLNDRGETLRAGQFVMTGSSIVTQFPAPGDELLFSIDGLGEVRIVCR